MLAYPRPFEDAHLSELLPGNFATLGEWHRYSLERHGADLPATGHLEELIDRFGKYYCVEFSTEDFDKYLNTINAAYLADEEAWNHYAPLAAMGHTTHGQPS